MDKRCRLYLRPTNNSSRVDETYIQVCFGKYLYRAVNSDGNTLDFLLSAKWDAKAAKQFFYKILKSTHNQSPRVINVDKNDTEPKVIDELKADETLSKITEQRPAKYFCRTIDSSKD